MYACNDNIATPRSFHLMHTLVQEDPLVRVSTTVWYPFGKEFDNAHYETWIFSQSPLVTNIQRIYKKRDIRYMIRTHCNMVRTVRRHLVCNGDKEAALALAKQEILEHREQKHRWNSCQRKRTYWTPGAARWEMIRQFKKGKLDPKRMKVYECEYCTGWHFAGGWKSNVSKSSNKH